MHGLIVAVTCLADCYNLSVFFSVSYQPNTMLEWCFVGAKYVSEVVSVTVSFCPALSS